VTDKSQDTYEFEGIPTTMGYVAWRDRIASKDSSMVKILRDAGGACRFPSLYPIEH